MKIYTKTGDQGSTSLYGGKRVSKDDLQIESYGTIDELNSQIGVLVAMLDPGEPKSFLVDQQHHLFSIGAHLAQDFEKSDLKLPELVESRTRALEDKIDEYQKNLEPLRQFILPGGGLQASQAHVCRTVCRRAERRVVGLSSVVDLNPVIIIYLNRLSDFFFVLSRYLTKINGKTEQTWIQ